MQQVRAVIAAPASKCNFVFCFFFCACTNRSVYLGANQSVEPLDRLHVPDDAVHSVYVEHDLAQG